MEVTNRFKGLDLINREPEELWTEVHNIVQEAVIKTNPKKKMQKGKGLSEEVLQIAEIRREAKSKGKREKHTHLNADKKAFKWSVQRRRRKTIEWEIPGNYLYQEN